MKGRGKVPLPMTEQEKECALAGLAALIEKSTGHKRRSYLRWHREISNNECSMDAAVKREEP